MAIIKQGQEMLVNLRGTKHIDLDELINKSHEIRDSFTRVKPDPKEAMTFFMDKDRNIVIPRSNDIPLCSDISEYAFGQACTLIGVPAGYMKKCYEKDMDDLVDYNIKRQYQRTREEGKALDGYTALVSDDVVEAIVSDKYAFGFQTPEVLETIRDCMPENYLPNQAYLSKSRAHIRFIDFDNPEDINGEKMTVGFTVGTSDIGKAALSVRFFIYKFSCKNGIVRISHGGTLYKQKHIGEPFTAENIDAFKRAFQDITLLREQALDEIMTAQSKMVSDREMQRIIDTCRSSQVIIKEEERAKIIDLAQTKYGRTMWGVINGITEIAQNHTLDTRLNYEIWADRLLRAA